MKRKLLGILTFAAAAGAVGMASAADLYVPTPAPGPIYTPVAAYNWSGFYAGVNGGWGWGQTDANNGNNMPVSGGTLGAQLGYNWAFANNVVLGVETDIAWTGFKGSLTVPGPYEVTMKQNWLGTVRGRVGYAFNTIMPYVTGGVAFGGATRTTEAPPGPGSNSQTHTGYVVGAGVEWAFAQNWTAKLEYNYVNLGRKTYDVSGSPSVLISDSIVKVGLNYKF